MPVSEKTKAKRKEIIIESALTLFVEKGFKDVSMDNIAENAGMVKATLYKYFSTKEDLFFAVSCIVTNKRWMIIKPKFEEPANGFKQVEQFLNNIIAHAYDNPDMFYFLTNSNQDYFETLFLNKSIDKNVINDYWHLVEEVFNEYTGMFTEGRKDGSIRQYDDIDIDMYVLYSIRGYLLERLTSIAKYQKKEGVDGKSLLNHLDLIKSEIEFLKKDLLNKLRVL